MLEVEVKSPSQTTICVVEISDSSTVNDLKHVIYEHTKISIERQLLKRHASDRNKLNDGSILSEIFTGIDVAEIYLKDLGPQISWRKVFVLEYLGALIAYPVTTYFKLHNTDAHLTQVQNFALIFWVFHYIKRIYETYFIHRFSHSTMPLRNLFKNCSYYWLFSILIAYNVNWVKVDGDKMNYYSFFFAFLFLFCEFGNYYSHVLLRDLRPPNSTIRKIPVPDGNIFNLLFKYVCCPNYTYEVGVWLSFSCFTKSWSCALFTICGFLQMTTWALQKQCNYRKEFTDFNIPWAIIPGLL